MAGTGTTTIVIPSYMPTNIEELHYVTNNTPINGYKPYAFSPQDMDRIMVAGK